jgi:hypothetical protein
MNYLNIHTDLLRSEEYLGAEPVERATWLNLMGWCASQENGGIIKDAHDWTDRKWQQLCGVTLREIQTPSKLYFFKDGGNLVVWSYPADKEKEVKTNRKNGKRGGRPRKEETQKKPGGFESENQVVSNRETDLKTEWFEIAETEGKGREGNGKKSKEKNIPELEQVVEYLIPKMAEIHSGWTPTRVRKAAKLRLETFIDAGWKDGNGRPIKNWQNKFMNCMKHEKYWNYEDQSAAPIQKPQAERCL